jgi:DNA-binding CsgD family transcriptional regulator
MHRLFQSKEATLTRLSRLGLTARESEVLTWVAQGKGNGDIALILGISPRTIEKHLQRIYEKLGVETRTAAALWALQDRRDE